MSNPSVYREITLEQLLNDSPSYSYRWEVLSTSNLLDYPKKDYSKLEFNEYFYNHKKLMNVIEYEELMEII